MPEPATPEINLSLKENSLRKLETVEKAEDSQFEIAGCTLASEWHPEHDEDKFFVSVDAVGVFDGMGGYSGGEMASRASIKNLEPKLKEISNKNEADPIAAVQRIKEVLINAHEEVKGQQSEQNPEMAATASVVCLFRRSRQAAIGSVGDSRVYLLRNNNLEQITLDDNLVQREKDETSARQLQAKLNNVIDPDKELTNEEKRYFNTRNKISQALGLTTDLDGKLKPHVYRIPLIPGDKLLVCSDGVSDSPTDNQIKEVLSSDLSSEELSRLLVEQARKWSETDTPRAKPDDMTAIVIKVKSAANLSGEIPIGKTVKVLRSDNTVEDGWTLMGFDKDGDAVVKKYEKDEAGKTSLLAKSISKKLLQRLN
jgi:protein phosphatase